MRRLFCILAMFLAVNFFLMVLLVRLEPLQYEWTDANTDSVLLPMDDEVSDYDFVLMGTSHARTFSRGSHKDLDALLGLTHFNLARGGGGGIIPASVFLEYFYARGNNADTVVYMVDPYVFFSPKWNENRYFAQDEPLDFRFLWLMIKYGVSWDSIWNYVQFKFSWRWFRGPEEDWTKSKSQTLSKIRSDAVESRLESLYVQGISEVQFRNYQLRFLELVELCRDHSSSMVFFFPPTLLGKQPGQDMVGAWLAHLAEVNPDIMFEDHSNSVLGLEYYYNHDHLNFAGVRHVIETILKPILLR